MADEAPLDHPGKARGRKRRAALADEDERRRTLTLQAAQHPQLIAKEGMRALRPVLDPPDTCETAPLKSIWSQRRSQTSAARSPRRKATTIRGASRCRSPVGLRRHRSGRRLRRMLGCSRVRSSALGRRVGATVRKISVGAINWSAEFVNEIPLPARQLFVLHAKSERRQAGETHTSQTVGALFLRTLCRSGLVPHSRGNNDYTLAPVSSRPRSTSK